VCVCVCVCAIELSMAEEEENGMKKVLHLNVHTYILFAPLACI